MQNSVLEGVFFVVVVVVFLFVLILRNNIVSFSCGDAEIGEKIVVLIGKIEKVSLDLVLDTIFSLKI